MKLLRPLRCPESALLLAAVAVAFASCSPQPTAPTRMKLSQAVESKAIAVLREGLHAEGDEFFWVSIHAAEGLTLGGLGEEAREFLEPLLETETDAQRRCGIARELVRAGDREKVAALAEVLRRDDSYGHTHAAESLYKVDEVGDEAAMRARYLHGGDIKLRLMAAAALARQGDEEAFAYIRETLRGAEPEGVQIAAWILAVIGGEEDIEPLRSRIADAPTPIIRAYLEHALASLGDEEGLALLSRNLEDEDPVIRTYAATFAGDARAYSTQAQLEAMLNDSFMDARVRAAQTLLQLSR